MEIKLPNSSHAALYVDIVCSECGKLMALSNAFQAKNKYYCPRCTDVLFPLSALLWELAKKER
jgi:hypothetical protein